MAKSTRALISVLKSIGILTENMVIIHGSYGMVRWEA